MRVLVTGASGFVGRFLVEHLRSSGDEVLPADPTQGVDVCDPASITAALEAARPEAVYHLAAQSDVGRSWHDEAATWQINLHGTLNVLAACRATGVGRVLAVTSADIYGQIDPERLPVDETAPLRPISPYAASKAAADLACVQAFLGHDQDVVRTRSFNHLGPGQRPGFVAAALALRIAEAERDGSDSIRVGTTDTARDFTDVRDVVRAYRLVMLHGRAGEAYNVCSGHAITIRELTERLIALAHRPLALELDPGLLRPADVPVLVGDPTKLEAATGWTRQWDLDASLADVLATTRADVARSGAGA